MVAILRKIAAFIDRYGPFFDAEPAAPGPRIAELTARAEKAEGERDHWKRQAEAAQRNAALFQSDNVPLAKTIADQRVELASLRAAGTFNEGIEAGVVAGWNACRRSVYAVCEDIGTEADRNRSDTENPPRHHFGRGECDAVKRIARAFNSMEALDDDNATAAIRSLRRPENEVT